VDDCLTLGLVEPFEQLFAGGPAAPSSVVLTVSVALGGRRLR
jgi:hypothetical protein